MSIIAQKIRKVPDYLVFSVKMEGNCPPPPAAFWEASLL